MRLYKYIPAEYVDSFVNEGAVLFRSLAHFRHLEESVVRGDSHEGSRLYSPQQGLEIKKSTGERIVTNWSFESSVKTREIFVFCLSTTLEVELFHDFKTIHCIEILRPEIFISRIRLAILRRPKIKACKIINRGVSYYNYSDPPIEKWATPLSIIFSKSENYKNQSEHRIVFGPKSHFKTNSVETQLISPNKAPDNSTGDYPEHLLKIGPLKGIVKIHKLT